MILGAILAGGQSRRFGGDKALAMLDGRPLMTHAVDSIFGQVSEVAVIGRSWDGLTEISDAPDVGLGPLGGINGAMLYAKARGLQAVLIVPVDVVPLPSDLVERLSPAPAVLDQQHVIGLWPVALQPVLADLLDRGERTMRSWIEASDARRVDDSALGLLNINRPEDLPRH